MVGKVRMSGSTFKLLYVALIKNPQGAPIRRVNPEGTGLGSGTMYPASAASSEMAKWIEGELEKIDPSEHGRP